MNEIAIRQLKITNYELRIKKYDNEETVNFIYFRSDGDGGGVWADFHHSCKRRRQR